MKLTVKRQNFQEVPSWGIFYGETFLAYSLTRLGAERAKKELQAMISVQGKQLTQAAIDQSRSEEPMTPLRKVYHNAARQVS
jgi:hypothetical protein